MQSHHQHSDLDLYGVLNVPHYASCEQIQRSYKNLSRIFHPDRLSGSLRKNSNTINENLDLLQVAQETFVEINVAKELLCDDVKRFVYDRYGWKGIKLLNKLSMIYKQQQHANKQFQQQNSRIDQDNELLQYLNLENHLRDILLVVHRKIKERKGNNKEKEVTKNTKEKKKNELLLNTQMTKATTLLQRAMEASEEIDHRIQEQREQQNLKNITQFHSTLEYRCCRGDNIDDTYNNHCYDNNLEMESSHLNCIVRHITKLPPTKNHLKYRKRKEKKKGDSKPSVPNSDAESSDNDDEDPLDFLSPQQPVITTGIGASMNWEHTGHISTDLKYEIGAKFNNQSQIQLGVDQSIAMLTKSFQLQQQQQNHQGSRKRGRQSLLKPLLTTSHEFVNGTVVSLMMGGSNQNYQHWSYTLQAQRLFYLGRKNALLFDNCSTDGTSNDGNSNTVKKNERTYRFKLHAAWMMGLRAFDGSVSYCATSFKIIPHATKQNYWLFFGSKTIDGKSINEEEMLTPSFECLENNPTSSSVSPNSSSLALLRSVENLKTYVWSICYDYLYGFSFPALKLKFRLVPSNPSISLVYDVGTTISSFIFKELSVSATYTGNIFSYLLWMVESIQNSEQQQETAQSNRMKKAAKIFALQPKSKLMFTMPLFGSINGDQNKRSSNQIAASSSSEITRNDNTATTTTTTTYHKKTNTRSKLKLGFRHDYFLGWIWSTEIHDDQWTFRIPIVLSVSPLKALLSSPIFLAPPPRTLMPTSMPLDSSRNDISKTSTARNSSYSTVLEDFFHDAIFWSMCICSTMIVRGMLQQQFHNDSQGHATTKNEKKTTKTSSSDGSNTHHYSSLFSRTNDEKNSSTVTNNRNISIYNKNIIILGDRVHHLMVPVAKEKRRMEKNNNGLVILVAKKSYDLVSPQSTETKVNFKDEDVTMQLQFWVADGKLNLPSTMFSSLPNDLGLLSRNSYLPTPTTTTNLAGRNKNENSSLLQQQGRNKNYCKNENEGFSRWSTTVRQAFQRFLPGINDQKLKQYFISPANDSSSTIDYVDIANKLETEETEPNYHSTIRIRYQYKDLIYETRIIIDDDEISHKKRRIELPDSNALCLGKAGVVS